MNAGTFQSAPRAAPARRAGGDPTVTWLAAGVGVSLLVMSVLHLTHVIAGGSPPYDPDAAGTAEGVIALVLLVAADRLRREPETAQGFALGALVFAVAGFVIGLVLTTTGGTTLDVAYHCVGLPLLLFALWRQARVVRTVRRTATAKADRP
jgi:peptidoglycan/LPS O-acetylase OafA/YrhL